MKKKILALVLSTAMIASLAGCGSSTTATAEPAASDKAETETETAATEEVVEEEAITTTMLVWSPAEDQNEEQGAWLQKMCEQFSAEHPNWDITFEYGVCPEGEAKTTITQDVEAAADVYMFANDNLPDLIGSNAIAKIGGETADYVKSTNSEAIVNSVSVDGDVYGVPFTTNTWFLYYDKSVFTADDIKSLDAMIAKNKIAFPLTNSWYLGSFFVANGGTLYGDGTDEAAGIDFGGDKGVAVTEYLVTLAANPNFVNDADGAGLAGLRDGSVKAIFSGSWDASAAKEALGDNFAAAALPCVTINGEEKQLKAFAGSKAIGVNPTCEYPQVAVALAKYLGSAEAQRAHYELRSVVPCNTELLAQDDISADPLVSAQNAVFDTTSIIQPFVAAMGRNYWGNTDNFGKAIMNKEITLDNAADKLAAYNEALNSSDAE